MSFTTFNTLDDRCAEWHERGCADEGEEYNAAVDAMWRHADALVNRADSEIYTIEDALLNTAYRVLYEGVCLWK